MSRRTLLLLVLLWCLLGPATALAFKMESGEVRVNATSGGGPTFTAHVFQQAYDVPPVVFTMTTNQGGDSSIIRIRNVTTTGFEAVMVETPGEDGPHVAMDVHYFAIEPGVHTMTVSDEVLGSRTITLEAGQLNTSRIIRCQATPSSCTGMFDSHAFAAPFAATPVVLLELQTFVNGAAGVPPAVPVPFITASLDNVSSGGFDFAIDRHESTSGSLTPPQAANETIGYLALDADITAADFVANNAAMQLVELETIRVDSAAANAGLGWDNGCNRNISYSKSFNQRLIVATKQTRLENDGGWLRRCSINSSRVRLVVDEDVDGDNERGKLIADGIGIVLSSTTFFYDSNFVPVSPDPNFKMEAGTITVVPGVFQVFTLQQYYETAPAVFFLPDSSNPDPSALRLVQVRSNAFTGQTRIVVQLAEPPGETLGGTPSEVHYIAIDQGSHVMPDGTHIEVGEVPVGALQQNFGGADSFQAVTFDAPFAAPPALLAQINGSTNLPANPTGIWLTVAIDTGSTTVGGFNVALERSEVNAGGPVTLPENVFFMAIDQGTIGSFFDNAGNSVNGEAQVSLLNGNSNAGWDNICFLPSYPGIPFLNTYASAPIVVAHEMSHFGGDGGWHRRCALTSTHVRIAEDEDRFANGERSHTREETGLVAFSREFAVDFALAAFWPMEEPVWNAGVPGQVDNLRDSAHDGTANDDANTALATPARTVGTDGTCRYGSFDGSQGGGSAADGVDAGNDDPVFGDEVSVAAWVRWSVPTGARNVNAVVVRNDSAADFDNFQFSLHATNNRRGFVFSVVTDNGTGSVSTGNFASTGQWYHVAGVYDGTELRIYVDGVLDNSNAHSGDIVAYDPVRELTVGRSSNAAVNYHGFTGLIDEVRVYRRALPPEEVELARLFVRDCPLPLHDQYAVTHAGPGVTCEAEPVLVSAQAAAGPPHAAVPPPAGTVMTITASTADAWALGSIGSPARFTYGGGTSATYEFDGVETEVELLLSRTAADVVSFTISDTAGRAHDPAQTPTLEFKEVIIDIDPIGPAIAGRPESAMLQLVEDLGNGVCQAATPPPGTVDFAVECLNPASNCSGVTAASIDSGGSNYPIAVGDAGAAVPGGAVALTFNAASEATFDLNYNDAGEVRLLASAVVGTPAVTVTGTSLPFAVRPFGFLVDVPGDPGGPPDATRQRFVPADTPFTVTLTPVGWQSVDDVDNDGIVDGVTDTDPTNAADLSDNRQLVNFRTVSPAQLNAYLVAPTGAGTSDPGITDGGATPVNVGPFTGASASLASVQYDEVGVIEVRASQSGNYLGLGGATGDIRGASGGVGRFIPARYEVGPGTDFDLRNGTGAWVCGFTYIGQPFGYDMTPTITVTAKTASGSDALNYGGAFYRFGSVPARSYADITAPAPAVPLVDLGTGFTVSDQNDFGDGGFELQLLNDSFRFDRTALQTPFDPLLELTISAADLTDADDACHTTAGAVCNTTLGPAVAEDYVKNDITTAGVEMRFGRLVLDSAFGSELQPLPLPMRIEHYAELGVADDFTDGLAPADDCTTLSLAGAVRLTGSGGEQDGNTVVPLVGSGTTRLLDSFPPAIPATDPLFSGSTTNLLFEPPTPAGGTGFVDVRVDLAVDGLEWLRYDWDGGGAFDDDPTARASFGLFPGRREYIYIREPWD